MKSIQTFRQKDCYQTELWRALYQKAPKGQFLIFRETHTEFTKRKLFSNYTGRIFQVKEQSKRVILLFFCSVFIVYTKIFWNSIRKIDLIYKVSYIIVEKRSHKLQIL